MDPIFLVPIILPCPNRPRPFLSAEMLRYAICCSVLSSGCFISKWTWRLANHYFAVTRREKQTFFREIEQDIAANSTAATTTVNNISVSMPDPIRKRFGYGQLWPLRPACSQNRAGSYMHPSQFPFCKEGMAHTVQNRPGSDLDGLARVCLNSSGLKASRCAGISGSGFWQDATGPLPVSHFQTRFRSSTDVRILLCQTGPDPI